MKKRILSALLSLCMVLTMLPAMSAPAQAANDKQIDAIMNMDQTVPDGYDPDSTENPYGYPLNQPFMMNAHNELALYTSYKESDSDCRYWTTWYDNWSGEGGSMDLARQTSGDRGGFDYTYSYADTKVASYVESVAFDPNGTGRKDHIAYIGYVPVACCISVWVVDATQHNRKYVYDFPMTEGAKNWLETTNFDQLYGANYFAITAGDYNGDGRESLVVYLPNDMYNYGMAELQLLQGHLEATASGQKHMLHPKYVNEVHGHIMARCTDDVQYNKLCCDLKTGDFDRDGIDDLAVLSYIMRPSGKSGDIPFQHLDIAYYWPWLRVAYGEAGAYTALDSGRITGFTEIQQSSTDADSHIITANSMVSPGMAVGDVDGDNIDEIVIAGHKNQIISLPSSRDAFYSHTVDGGKNNIVIYQSTGDGLSNTELHEVAANGWDKGGFYNTYYAWQPAGVECVAFNGSAAAEYIFLNGTVYDQAFNALYTPDYFTERDDQVEPLRVLSSSFISSLAPGNYDGNDYGYEQLALSVGLKSTGANKYTFKLMMIGGKNYGPDGGPVGGTGGTDTAKFYCSDPGDGTYVMHDKGGASQNLLNCILTPMDRDHDGRLAKYVGKNYTYADPKVMAVLQAAPYFDELGDNYLGDNYGETTYTVTQEYDYTYGESDSGSVGLGASVALEGTIGSIDMTLKQENEWSVGFEKSLTESYTTSFSAGGYDSVIVYRTPVFIYNYVFYDTENNCWGDVREGKKDLSASIAIPKGPSYQQMSVEDFNRFVAEYNKMVDSKYDSIPDTKENPRPAKEKLYMKELNLSYLGQRGNPWGYADYMTQISLDKYDLGYNGGSTSSAHSDGTASAESISHAHGFSFDMTAMFGFDAGFVSSMAGVTGSIGYMHEFSTTETKSSTTETSGTVVDLDSEALTRDFGIPRDVIRAYGFTWALGKDYCDLGSAGDIKDLTGGEDPLDGKTLVVGYKVTNITAPAPAVSDLTAELAGKSSADLSWTDPSAEGRLPVHGYHVYQKAGDGGYVRLTDKPITDTAFYAYGLDSNTEYTFVVTTVNTEKGESVFSNRATVKTPKKNVPLTFEYNDYDVTVRASHIGNVNIRSGDVIPEDTIVDVWVTPVNAEAADPVTAVELVTEDGVREITLENGAFNFVIHKATTVRVTTVPVAPGAPANLQAELTNDTTAELTWDAPTDSLQADGYNVYRRLPDGNVEKLTASPVTETVYTVTGLAPGTEYTYFVKAYNTEADVEGQPSNDASVETPVSCLSLTFRYDATAVTVQAKYADNTLIEDLDAIPEGSVVYVEIDPLTAGASNTVTSVKLTADGVIKDVTTADNRFNFVIRHDTVIQIASAPVASDSFVSYTASELDGEVPSGTVSGAVNGTVFDENGAAISGSVIFTARPAEGYRLKEWLVLSVDGAAEAESVIAASGNTLSFFPYAPEHHVRAVFVSETDPSVRCTVEVKPVANGTLTVRQGKKTVTPDENGLISVLKGTSLTFTVTPDEGYSFREWTDDLVNHTNLETAITLKITEDLTVGAVFYAPLRYPLTFTAGVGGTVTAALDGAELTSPETVLPGSRVSFSAVADDGYRVESFVLKQGKDTDALTFDRVRTTYDRRVTVNSRTDVYVSFAEVQTFEITFDPGDGYGTPFIEIATEGVPFELPPRDTFEAPMDMVFDGWLIDNDVYRAGRDYVFTEDTVVTALWDYDDFGGGGGGGGGGGYPALYDVEVERVENGLVLADPDFGAKGDEIILNVLPDNGCELLSLIVTDRRGRELELDPLTGQRFSFEMPASDVLVTAVFVRTLPPVISNPFTDVFPGDFYYDAVQWAVQQGITQGTGNGLFLPNADCTRAQMVTFLWRWGGSPAPMGYGTSFADVPADAWYSTAVQWAVEKGITLGTGENRFSPELPCSRAQMTVFLHRMQGQPAAYGANPFTDVAPDAYYYKAVLWAVEKGVTLGTGAGRFSPDLPCSRGQMVTFLYRCSMIG